MTQNNYLPTIYSQFIYKSRYSRWIPEENRREDWPETVDRYINYFKDRLHVYEDSGHERDSTYDKEHNTLSEQDWEDLRNAILNLEVMPSMRALMTAGPALDRCNVAAFNCSYVPIDHPRAFDEILYILMCGTGVGFSVERQSVNQLPVVNEHFEDSDTTIVVEDSKSGWAKGYRELITMLYAGRIPKWDLSKLRPAGARLKTFGGRSSGPEPLNDLFNFTVNVFRGAAGRRLRSIEAHDLACKIGDVVVVGGVRRSALISLSNLSDERMRDAKSGNWWEKNPQRALANNSVSYTEKPDMGAFMREWYALYQSGSGERGIFNRQASKAQAAKNGRRDPEHEWGTNPCSEIILRPYQFCNLTEVIVRSTDTLDDLKRKVRLATILGTLQSSLTDFKYLRKVWHNNTKEECLLGVSLTGILDNRMLTETHWDTGLTETLEEMKKTAVEVNKQYAEILGVNQSTAITCVKPSGTVSQLTDTASGIHTRHSPYYIRTVRGDKKDPLTAFLIAQGIPAEDCVMKPDTTVVFSFPMKAPDGALVRSSLTAIEHLDLWLGYQRHWCVTGDTKILTDQGYKEIQQTVSYPIRIWNGEEWSVVTPYETGIQPVFEVSLSNGAVIKCTGDHKFILKNGSKKPLNELSEGIELAKFDMPVVELGNYGLSYDPYSQGFYSGDGFTGRQWTQVFAPKYTCLKRLKGEISTLELPSRKAKYWKHGQMLSKDFVPTGSVLTRLNWLAGLIDSDGSKQGKGFSISSINSEFLNRVRLMLTTLGVQAIVRPNNKARIALMPDGNGGKKEYACKATYQLLVSGNDTKKLINLGLHTERVELIGTDSGGSKSVKIESINYIGEEPTYCFTEPKANRGTFEGVVLGQCEHKPSVTISVQEKEWMEVGAWVYEHFDECSGVSFLPQDGGTYKQAPYQECTKEEYEALLARMPTEIDWQKLQDFEKEDTTTGMQTMACSGTSCEIVDFGNGS